MHAVRRVAHVAHEVLDEIGAVGWPKTSGGNGLHIYVRIEPRWGFTDVRRGGAGLRPRGRAPDPRRRHHDLVAQGPRPTDKVFVDYNQNARDHTIASAYSVRGNREGTVSTPIAWDELDDV